jgi:hypothetical protein
MGASGAEWKKGESLQETADHFCGVSGIKTQLKRILKVPY